MLKKTITYTDYNGIERTEDFFFNLNKAELTELQMGTTGGLDAMLEKIIATKDTVGIMRVFKDILVRAYGEKSADGKRFIKSKEIADAFVQTEAYSTLFMELCSNEENMANFIKGILPPDVAKQVQDQSNKPLQLKG